MTQASFEQKRLQTAQRLNISAQAVPRHIAVIMDGNGRWAAQQKLPRFHGHEKGAKTVQTIAQHCSDCGVECLTIYSFSMQNWKRPKDEIDFLMHLYAAYLEGIRPSLMENNVRLRHIGRKDPLPRNVLDALDQTVKMTEKNTGMNLGLALNYDSQTEIADAAKSLAEKCLAGQLEPEQINPQKFAEQLYTAGWPEVDLLIRTSGEMRISNFLLWQISYAEFYVTPILWPDFSCDDLDKAILAFAQRARRFGDVSPAEKKH